MLGLASRLPGGPPQQCALCDHSWHRKGPLLRSPSLQHLLAPWELEWRGWGMKLTGPDLDVRGSPASCPIEWTCLSAGPRRGWCIYRLAPYGRPRANCTYSDQSGPCHSMPHQRPRFGTLGQSPEHSSSPASQAALEWANAVWKDTDSARDHYPEFTRRFRAEFTRRFRPEGRAAGERRFHLRQEKRSAQDPRGRDLGRWLRSQPVETPPSPWTS